MPNKHKGDGRAGDAGFSNGVGPTVRVGPSISVGPNFGKDDPRRRGAGRDKRLGPIRAASGGGAASGAKAEKGYAPQALVAEKATPGGAPPKPVAAETQLDWIEVELVDDGGQWIGGVEYLLVCPDGSSRKGTTRAEGPVREEGITPGMCTVSFPGLDEDDPEEVAPQVASQAPNGAKTLPPAAIANAPTEEQAAATHWVEIELVNSKGVRVGGKMFEVKGQNGVVAAGTTSAENPVRVEGLTAGDCTVSFPSLDADAWDAA